MPRIGRSSFIIILLSQIYNEYRYKIKSKISNKAIIKPWMKYREIEIIEEILKRLRPKKCLEWGSGNSTIYFPNFVSKNSNWISIEHEKDWAAKIKSKNQNLNVEIFHITPNHFPWTDDHEEGTYSDLMDYVEFPSKFGNFDFILIDGGARKGCLIKAYKLLKNEGIVVLHDANSDYYNEPFVLYKHYVLFRDYRNSAGGLWIGSKGININEILDVNKYKKLWRIYNKIGKIGKVLKI